MSACQCIKCESIVGGYKKYCDDCIKKYGVKQDSNWFRTHHFDNWDIERKREFEKDVTANAHFNVSKNIKPETMDALREMGALIIEQSAQHSVEQTIPKQGKKPRRRVRKNKVGPPA